MSPEKRERKVGVVEHYYPKAHAAAIALQADLKIGDEVHIVGHGDDLRENVISLQLDHKPIQAGHRGQHIGLEVPWKVHKKADVFKVEDMPEPRAKPAARKAARKAPKAHRKAAKRPAKKAQAKRARKPAKAPKARKAAKRPARKAAARPARKMAKKAGRKKR